MSNVFNNEEYGLPYQGHGESPEVGNIKRPIAGVVGLYGDIPADEFMLKQVRAVEIACELGQVNPERHS